MGVCVRHDAEVQWKRVLVFGLMGVFSWKRKLAETLRNSPIKNVWCGHDRLDASINDKTTEVHRMDKFVQKAVDEETRPCVLQTGDRVSGRIVVNRFFLLGNAY